MNPLSEQQRELLSQGHTVMLWNHDELYALGDRLVHDGVRLTVVATGTPFIGGAVVQRVTVREVLV